MEVKDLVSDEVARAVLLPLRYTFSPAASVTPVEGSNASHSCMPGSVLFCKDTDFVPVILTVLAELERFST